MEQLIPWTVLCLVALALCVARPVIGRVFLGVFYVAMAIVVNAVLALVAPDQFVALGTTAPLVWPYAWFFANVVALSPALFGLLAATYEVAVGLLLLGKGRAVRLGIAGGIVHLLAITPLGVWTLGNPLLALALATLLRRDYERTLPEMMRSILRRAPLRSPVGTSRRSDGDAPEGRAV